MFSEHVYRKTVEYENKYYSHSILYQGVYLYNYILNLTEERRCRVRLHQATRLYKPRALNTNTKLIKRMR